jgi:hypothetical protein
MGKKTKIPNEGKCFWCGQHSNELTEDHVPPKLLFPARVHSLLPWVLACPGCNEAWQKDAEYFRDFLFLGALCACQHPELAPIRKKFDRARANRLRDGKRPSVFASSPFTVSMFTFEPGFQHEDSFRMSDVDLGRIGSVIVRTLFGVHFRFMVRQMVAGTIGNIRPLIPEGHTISACDISQQLYPRALELLKAHGRRDFGDGLFSWLVCGTDESPENEYLLGFYDAAIFHVRICPVGATELVSALFDGHRYPAGNLAKGLKRKIMVPESTDLTEAIREIMRSGGGV